ncbi:hypothetical protein [Microcystis sp. M086S1]|uniref:hypothetical protein n=1 Tax=Microcystis sp. M086S1 TaxID=2771133 RepID=UPI002589C32D|nr:hypothetical protein [Microcystis sp. M086S1]
MGVGGWGLGCGVWGFTHFQVVNYLIFRLFGFCYAMDGGYKGWNPYIERHLAIFVNQKVPTLAVIGGKIQGLFP